MSGAGDLKILVLAGGTGGHVYPALAVAQRLREQGVRVAWMGTRRGLEAKVVPGAGIEIHYIRVTGLRGKGMAVRLLAPFRLVLALLQSVRITLGFWPHAVLGMGGFVAGPGGVAAWLLRRPLLVHEQNAVPGLTNRYLARLAVRIMEAFPGSFPARFSPLFTGNPVRADIIALPPPETRGVGQRGLLRLLVLGGSQGARALNEAVPAALAASTHANAITVRHQCGAAHLADTCERYRDLPVSVEVVPYLTDMAQAYAWADLVVCRAGAMTIAELAAAGVAAILVPFPHAVDDHQSANARYLTQAQAARVLPESALSPARLGALLAEFQKTRQVLLNMARAARAAASPWATDRVAALCVEAARA